MTPAIPDLTGITESSVWTSETILQLERLPQRLIVPGGGYVGCEFASMFALFGTQVTLLQGPDQRFLGAIRPLVGAIPVEAMRRANYMVDRDSDKASPQIAARWLARQLEHR